MGEHVTFSSAGSRSADSGQNAGYLMDAVIPVNDVHRDIKIRVIDRPETAGASLAEIDGIRGGSTLQPIGVASRETPGSSSDGVVTRPGRKRQSIVAVVKIIRLGSGFVRVTDEEKPGGEGREG